MKTARFELDTYRAGNQKEIAKVFTGRDRGKTVKEESRFNDLFKENDRIDFIIPDNLFSINPSFFEELFNDVIKQYGKEEFLKRMKFDNLGKYNFQKPLNEAIARILRNKNALGGDV